MRASPVLIDGQFGVGGGQILRPALALSLATGQAVQILDFKPAPNNNRWNEPRSRQTRYALEMAVAARLCGASWTQSIPRSGDILFAPPRRVSTGKIRLDPGEENYSSLVAQTILPALALDSEESVITILGLTHAPLAPTPEFLKGVYLPTLRRMKIDASIRTKTFAYYFDRQSEAPPGELILENHPSQGFESLEMIDRGRALNMTAYICSSGISRGVAIRGMLELRELIPLDECEVEVKRDYHQGKGEGIAVTLTAACEGGFAGFTSHGEKGVRMEDVVRRTTVAFKQWWRSGAACDHHLAEHLIVPMALAKGRSQIRFSGPAENVRTVLYVAGEMLPIQTTLEAREDGTTLLTVEGAGVRRAD